jgi:hypothetical protein
MSFRLAEALLEKETLALPDIVEIMGARPYPYKATILEYLEELKLRDVEDKEEEVKKAEEIKTEEDKAEPIEEDKKKEESKEDETKK